MKTIEIKGAIIPDSQAWIYDWLEMPYTSASKVNKAIAEATDGEELEVIINSGGGSVAAGSEIYTALRSYKGNSVGKIYGMAASAASVVAMGVKQLQISPTATMMIHQASTYSEGNKKDFEQTAKVLNVIDNSIANAYIGKTKMAKDKLMSMMNEETWLDADKAKNLGFVDSIMFEDEFQATASIGIDKNGMIPEKIINKLMEEFKNKAEKEIENKTTEETNIKNLDLEKAKLELLLL